MNGELRETFTNFIYQAKRNAKGEIDGILFVIYDVTDQVLAKQRMEQALRARDEFLSIASHKLKTPLTSIQLQTQMAKRNIEKNRETAFEPARVVKLIDQTDHSLRRLTRLVDDMLDISRITTGKLTFHRETLDLLALVREVVGNLLTNAIRYGEGSPIKISVKNQADRAVLIVQDAGPGIAQENQDRIFERFERATPASSISGLGLGLSISREIVNRHSGTLFLKSSPGAGASFLVDLPLNATDMP
ncbi:MAG: HAMP domain-containing histidine kinase [Cryobacterium sp.]|nr:HAMP domain-containing histidine kinase [Oligoflexia bacterium]